MNVHLFVESGKVVRHIFSSKFLFDNVLNLVTIYHPMMNRVCAANLNLYYFTDLNKTFSFLQDIVTINTYARDSCMVVSVDGDAGVQSRKCQASMDAINSN